MKTIPSIFLIRVNVVGLAAIVAAALFAQIAVADSTSRESGSVLTHKQVLDIALREATKSRDPHPKRIEMASGSMGAAIKVEEPQAVSGSALTNPELVDLVVMRGYFHLDASHPRGGRIAPGKILELIIAAHTGFVEGRSLGNEVPVLSHLGPVTRLR